MIPFVVLATSADPLSWLINYGVAGIIIILLVTGQLRTKAEVAAVQKIADERFEALKQKDLALEAMSQAVSHTLPELSRMTEVLDGLSRKIDSIERRA